MSTKIITVSATPPSPSSGADYNKGAPLNATEFDQNIVNLRAAVDSKQAASIEGTWSPTIAGTTSGTLTLTAQAGTYTRIGRRVWVQGRVAANVVTGLVGNIIIGGLPVAPAGFTGRVAVKFALVANLTGHTLATLFGTIEVGVSVITLRDAAGAAVPVSALASGVTLDFTADYITS